MKLKIGDFIIFGGIILITAMAFALNVQRSYNDKSLKVIVSINGEVVDMFDIGSDIEKEYDTEYGHNHITISDGKVYMLDADCLDAICITTGEIEKNGQIIVCLPNRFTVEIKGAGGGEVDVISQ